MDKNETHSPCDHREIQFHEAVREMFRYQRSSADFFRRKMFVGYSKATSYVVRLEKIGFLGPIPSDGTARKILKTWDEWLVWLKAHDVPFNPDHETYQNPWPNDGIDSYPLRTPSDANAMVVELVEADRAYHSLTVYASADTWLKYGERRSKAIAAITNALNGNAP